MLNAFSITKIQEELKQFGCPGAATYGKILTGLDVLMNLFKYKNNPLTSIYEASTFLQNFDSVGLLKWLAVRATNISY